MSNHHVNHVILVGKVLQTWSFEEDRGVRLQMRRAAFQPPRADGPSDLVIVILPGAIPRGQQVSEGDELHQFCDTPGGASDLPTSPHNRRDFAACLGVYLLNESTGIGAFAGNDSST